MELFRLLGTIAIDNSGANTALNETTDRAEGAHSRISAAFGKIGVAAKATGKVMAAGLAVGAAAVAALTKSALDCYADYEQLVGGVETLFGAGGKSLEDYAASVGKTTEEVKEEYEKLMSAQTAVLANADVAFQTAGMSANEYMETVTGFSASLIKSLGGDTTTAAEKANQAIIDMSDNANKMGSDITSIQNAYSGFAKQNYTMLDNLKLGYGGTQEEMKRLLADATAISKIEYDISSYADVVDAIHVIQEEMGIAGTTAKEASSTISGSIASMKSAWTNLLTGLGNEEVDLSGLMDQFVNSVLTVTDNVIPRIEVILGGMTTALAQIIPKITAKLPDMLQSVLPSLLQGAVSLIQGLLAALPTLIQIIAEQAPFILSQLGSALLEAVPQLLSSLKAIFGQIWNFISLELLNSGVSFDDFCAKASEGFAALWSVAQTVWETVGQPIWDMLSFAIDTVAGAFEDSLPSMQTSFQTSMATMKDMWVNVLKPALEDAGKYLNEYVKPAFEFVFSKVIAPLITTVFQAGADLWVNVLQPAFNAIADFLNNHLKPTFEYVFATVIQPLMEKTFTNIQTVWNNVLQPVFAAIAEYLNTKVKPVFEWVFQNVIQPVVSNVFSAISNLWTNTLKPVFTGICEFLNGVFTDDWDKALGGILKIVKGQFNAMITAVNTPIDIIRDLIHNAVEFIKQKFDFDWKFPDIKLPHFSINGSFSINPPSVPSFGIEWYAKGGVMNDPTLFGINPFSGKAMIGGEAGAEAIAPIDTLQEYIREAVAENNASVANAVNDGFSKLMAFLQYYIPDMANMQLVTDTGVLIGELAPGMDDALGRIAKAKERGAY